MHGVCKNGGCKVPGGLHSSYSCRNSECRQVDEGKACPIAPDEKGHFVAKCPYNLLPYEWDWPWTG